MEKRTIIDIINDDTCQIPSDSINGDAKIAGYYEMPADLDIHSMLFGSIDESKES